MKAVTAPGRLIPVEEYLSTSYEPEYDYVDRELEDRNVGEKDHSKLQFKLGLLLNRFGVVILPEVRMRASHNRYRVPDLAVYLKEPDEQVLTIPPFIVIEVLSPEDRMSRMLAKVQDFLQMGVEHVWILDSCLRKAFVCDSNGIHETHGPLTADPVRIDLAGDLGWNG